ncbi:MAG: hypothetical protein Q8R28_14550 [Dehalococcoidia bacterium]|nr:hypothetical protein [Dehalococcoidia bacterium]
MNTKEGRLIVFSLIDSGGGSFTETELRDALEANGCPQKQTPRLLQGLIRTLEIEDMVTGSPNVSGERIYMPTKKMGDQIKKMKRQGHTWAANERYYEAEARIRLLIPSLAGSLPEGDAAENGNLQFPRVGGRVVLLPVWFKALFRRVFNRLPLESGIGAFHADFLDFHPVFLDIQTGIMRIPVPPDRAGQPGKGVSVHETLPPGTEWTARFRWPATVVPKDRLRRFWEMAGYVGFSPGKSKLGYGTFEVLSVQVLGDVWADAEEEEAPADQQAAD